MKRSQLNRRTPLKPGGPNARKGPIKRKASRTAPTMADRLFWADIPKPCQACGIGGDNVIHHLLANVPGKVGRRDHRYVVRLCPMCHNMGTLSVHLLGSEAKFRERHGVDLVMIAVRNWSRYGLAE